MAGLNNQVDNHMVTRGSFTGDGTVNRAIEHGLGRIPKLVTIVSGSSATPQRFSGIIIGATTAAFQFSFGEYQRLEVTFWTATHFYVSVDAALPNFNQNAFAYLWVACS